MKLTRKWILVLALVLSVAMATGGTLAFLTDRDSDANVFTMGNVEIDLTEDYIIGSELIPGIEITKKPYITNTGKTEAWVWATVAVPAGLEKALDIDWTVDANWTRHITSQQVSPEDGLTYNVYTYLYNQSLVKGDVTTPVITSVTLKSNVDIDPNGQLALVTNGNVENVDWNYKSDNSPVIYVSAYAIQKEGFATVTDGYNNYNAQWGDNGTEWSAPSTAVSNVTELAAALNSNENIYLAKDITITSDWKIDTDAVFTGSLNGNGHTITFNVDTDESFVALVYAAENATFSNLKFEGNIKSKGYAAPIAIEMADSLVENCVNNADVTSGRAAGLVAWVNSSSVIKNCVNNGDITGNYGAAGIANRFAGTMTNCVNNGDIVANGTEPAGGIASIQLGASSYNYCVNNGKVSSVANNSNASAAGILGQTPSTAATFNYCVNTGKVSAEQSHASGIGYALYGNDTYNYCYNIGDVYGGDAAGGIAAKPEHGTASKAKNSLNAGAVTGGNVYNIAYTSENSFYYIGADLFANNGTAANTDDALKVLNGGSDTSFFSLENGVITVK